MDDLLSWIIAEKQWLFSGVGLVVLTGIIRVIYKGRQAASSQNIRSGNNSMNIQAGRDIKINSKPKRNNVE
ncbi:hypothetical protein [Nitrosomonas sp. Is37]|uniref:hypothetical protein n=1 Tax=Nitrosomonas sp. Is37 TaxID=3080535 RepID=UPI00294AF0EF|nr:hypothetical protein [Nitrosomonas sp. Is37]MDV6345586.1 hypothetical protein [Nitrosomonas sp. Is37]